jgi:anti-sigma B factor antagonist
MGDSDGALNRELLTVDVEQDGEALVISPAGELGLSTTQPLDAELRRAINGDVPEVILDLRGLSSIDSTGLRLLVFATAHSRGNGDRLRMLRGSSPVERVVQLSGLARSLPFID